MLDRRDVEGSASEDACAEYGEYRKEHRCPSATRHWKPPNAQLASERNGWNAS